MILQLISKINTNSGFTDTVILQIRKLSDKEAPTVLDEESKWVSKSYLCMYL